MNEDDQYKMIIQRYADVIALNAEGGITPLIYKLDTSLLASFVIKAFVEADMSAQNLLERYENQSSNLSQTEKEDLWESFRAANQTAAFLKQLIDDSKDVIVALPEAIKDSPDKLEKYAEDSRDPEGLKTVIKRWLDSRFQAE